MGGGTRRRWIGAASTAVGIALWNRAVRSASAQASTDGPHPRRTLHVGPLRETKTLREAAAIARDGDWVLVDPGEYRGDVAVWPQSGLIVRGNSGRVLLVANGASAEDKGTFVFRGGDALVENINFTGARSRDRNGAGIRLDAGSRLTVSRCRFEDNENGILTANDASSELHVSDSVFTRNGAGDGLSHNLYVGSIGKLTVTGCYLSRANVGHLLKTRARESVIAYSRLSGEDGTSSYELEFPSGGRAVAIGCLIQQGANSENSAIVSYGSEGYRWQQNELLISFCTIVNDRVRGGAFVRVPAGAARVEIVDNLLVGNGETDVRAGVSTFRNSEAKSSDFADPTRFDYHLRRSSKHIGAAGLAGSFGEGRLRPEREYVHPASSVALERYAALTAISPGAFQRIAA